MIQRHLCARMLIGFIRDSFAEQLSSLLRLGMIIVAKWGVGEKRGRVVVCTTEISCSGEERVGRHRAILVARMSIVAALSVISPRLKYLGSVYYSSLVV